MPKKIEGWQCVYCESKFQTEQAAQSCEDKHARPEKADALTCAFVENERCPTSISFYWDYREDEPEREPMVFRALYVLKNKEWVFRVPGKGED